MNQATYHVFEDEIWVPPLQLRDPTHTARPDHSASGEIIERADGPPIGSGIPLLHDQAVLPVLALEDRAQRAAIGQHGRDVFQTVDEHVDLTIEERDLELLRPERLAAEEVQRPREVLVALRGHEGRAELAIWEGGLERVEDDVGLDLRELGRARGEHDAAAG